MPSYRARSVLPMLSDIEESVNFFFAKPGRERSGEELVIFMQVKLLRLSFTQL